MARSIHDGPRAVGAASSAAPIALHAARDAGRRKWLSDLGDLLARAEHCFGDVAWRTGDGDVLWAHKALVYARSTAPFQSRYLTNGYFNADAASLSSLSLSHTSHGFLSPVPQLHGLGIMRAPSPASILSGPPSRSASGAIELASTDHALLLPALEVMYTASSREGMAEVFRFLFEEAPDPGPLATDKLREDLLFMWRSKLYADMQIQIVAAEDELLAPADNGGGEEDAAVYFTAHRAVMAQRSPYFANMLLSGFADSSSRLFTLPASAFTPASLHFLLGSMYCGTLDFSPRAFDLATALDILRGAQYLELDTVQAEIEASIADMCHEWRACCKVCARRSAHVLLVTLQPNLQAVGKRLAYDSMHAVVKGWSEAWAYRDISELTPSLREELVARVASTFTAGNAVKSLSDVISLRRRLEAEPAIWSTRTLDMVAGVEGRLSIVIAASFATIVSSSAFVELLDGHSFQLGREVLVKLLEVYVASLTDATAPMAYQTLTGRVLLREEGLLQDVRVAVEGARKSILNFLRRHWVAIRLNDGFEKLEDWALKEIADELELPVDDLLQPATEPVILTKTGLKSAPLRLRDSAQSLQSSVERKAGSQDIAVPNAGAPRTTAAFLPAKSKPLAIRTPLTGSTLRAKPRATVQTAAPTSTSLQPPVPKRISSARSPSVSPLAPAKADVGATAKPPVAAPATAASQPAQVKPSPIVRKSASALSVRSASATQMRPVKPAASDHPSNVARRRAVSTGTTRSSAGTVVGSRTSSEADPAAKRPYMQRGRPPMPTMPSPALSAVVGHVPKAATARTPSTATTRSMAGRPAPAGSSVAAPPTPSVKKAASAASMRTTATTRFSAPSRPQPTPKTPAPVRTSKPSSTPDAAERRARLKSSASSASLASKGKLKQSAPPSPTEPPPLPPPLPGTVLRVPLPALVSLSSGVKAKAKVHFLGHTKLGVGDWVGVVVDEDGLTATAKNRAGTTWCDGSVEGEAYFKGPEGRCAFVRPASVLFLF